MTKPRYKESKVPHHKTGLQCLVYILTKVENSERTLAVGFTL